MNPLDELTSYNNLMYLIAAKHDMISILDAESKAIKSGTSNSVSVKGSPIGDRLDSIIDEKNKIEAEIELYKSRLKLVDGIVSRMTESHAYIIRTFFMSGLNNNQAVQKIRDDKLFGDRWIYKLKQTAIEEFLDISETIIQ